MTLVLSLLWGTCYGEQKIAAEDVFPKALPGWRAGEITIVEKPYNIPEEWRKDIMKKNPLVMLMAGEEARREYTSPDGHHLIVIIDNSDCIFSSLILSIYEDPEMREKFNEKFGKEFGKEMYKYIMKGAASENRNILKAELASWNQPAIAWRDEHDKLQMISVSPRHKCLAVVVANNNDHEKEPVEATYIKSYISQIDFDMVKKYSDEHTSIHPEFMFIPRAK